jgi:dienelactone hydrolase
VLTLAVGLISLAAGTAGQSADDAVVGLWRFDEQAGPEAHDASGHGNDGRIAGATRMAGPHGGALHFDGVDDRVDFPASDAYGLSSQDTFAVDTWIRTRRRDFCTPLMARDGGNVSFSFIMGRQPGRIAWELWSWAGVRLISHADVADGKWHRVFGAYDAASGEACLLVDGKLEAVAKAGAGGPSKAALRLGNNIGAEQPFTGDIGELRITRQLPDEVARLLASYRRWTLLDTAGIRAMEQAYLDRMDRPHNPHAASRAEWEARRREVRRHVLDCLGLLPQPQRPPLALHVSGELDRDGYVVKRIYWQTWPHYYASGHLYVPKGLHGKAPAILNPHGHWQYGAREPVVQARLISLARKGYVCLAVDSVHAYDYYAGVTPLTVMTWNNIRGLDLLCSLPEVDPSRIGCTGCSGGAQQTNYLMAVDDRLAAAVPVCMVCELRRILTVASAHCSCNHVPGLLAETDQTEMAACLAPKPSLYVCVTGDWTKWFPQEGYPEIRSIFEVYGETGKVECTQYDWHHDYSQPMREQMCAWFNRWLKGTDDPAQAKEGTVQPERPEALSALDAPPEDARGPEAVFEETRARRAAPAYGTHGRRQVSLSADRLRGALKALLREGETLTDPALQVLGREVVDGIPAIRVLVRTEDDVRVPVVLLVPPNRTGPCSCVLISSDRGMAFVATAGWAGLRALVECRVCVALCDPRFLGEWALDAPAQRLNGVLLGRPPAAVGTHDLLAATAWLRGRPEVNPRMVGVIGLGDAGALALMAAALDVRIAFAAAPSIGLTYAQGRSEPIAPHLVTVGDLPQIAATCAPRPLYVAGAGNLDPWQVARQAFAAMDADAALRIRPDDTNLAADDFQEWLRAAASR